MHDFECKKGEMIDISPLIYTRDELLLSYFRQVFFMNLSYFFPYIL